MKKLIPLVVFCIFVLSGCSIQGTGSNLRINNSSAENLLGSMYIEDPLLTKEEYVALQIAENEVFYDYWLAHKKANKIIGNDMKRIYKLDTFGDFEVYGVQSEMKFEGLQEAYPHLEIYVLVKQNDRYYLVDDLSTFSQEDQLAMSQRFQGTINLLISNEELRSILESQSQFLQQNFEFMTQLQQQAEQELQMFMKEHDQFMQTHNQFHQNLINSQQVPPSMLFP